MNCISNFWESSLSYRKGSHEYVEPIRGLLEKWENLKKKQLKLCVIIIVFINSNYVYDGNIQREIGPNVYGSMPIGRLFLNEHILMSAFQISNNYLQLRLLTPNYDVQTYYLSTNFTFPLEILLFYNNLTQKKKLNLFNALTKFFSFWNWKRLWINC